MKATDKVFPLHIALSLLLPLQSAPTIPIPIHIHIHINSPHSVLAELSLL